METHQKRAQRAVHLLTPTIEQTRETTMLRTSTSEKQLSPNSARLEKKHSLIYEVRRNSALTHATSTWWFRTRKALRLVPKPTENIYIKCCLFSLEAFISVQLKKKKRQKKQIIKKTEKKHTNKQKSSMSTSRKLVYQYTYVHQRLIFSTCTT